MKNKALLFLPALFGLLFSCSNNNQSNGNVQSIDVSYGEDNTFQYGDVIDEDLINFSVKYENKTIKYKSSDFIASIDQDDTFNHEDLKLTVKLRKDESIKKTIDLTKINRKELKLLFIGNSFSDDTIEWMYFIAESLGIDLVAENMFIGGCTIDTHYSNILNNRPNYERVRRVGARWVREARSTLSDAIQSENWDFISFQQASGSSGIASTYNHLPDLIDEVYNLVNLPEKTQYVFNMTWAYQSDSTHSDFAKYSKDQMKMYNSIINAVVSEVLPLEQIKIVIPNGTAIQNARSSYIGDKLTRDGYHLSYDLGRYIAGLTAICTLTGHNPKDCKFTPIDDLEKSNIAKESAFNAINNKYEVTKSEYQDNPMSLEKLKETHNELTLTYNKGFYNATDASKVSGIFYSDSDNFTKQFCCTNILEASKIPANSVIYIKNGFKYRPEAWMDLNTKMTSRPEATSEEFVLVNSNWIKNYNYRAFNISKTNNAIITDAEFEQIKNGNIFKVFVPK